MVKYVHLADHKGEPPRPRMAEVGMRVALHQPTVSISLCIHMCVRVCMCVCGTFVNKWKDALGTALVL